MESGEVNVDEHTSNETHTTFNDPLIDHDKGNASNDKIDKQATYDNTSYTYISNIFECDPSQYYANVITFNKKD